MKNVEWRIKFLYGKVASRFTLHVIFFIYDSSFFIHHSSFPSLVPHHWGRTDRTSLRYNSNEPSLSFSRALVWTQTSPRCFTVSPMEV